MYNMNPVYNITSGSLGTRVKCGYELLQAWRYKRTSFIPPCFKLTISQHETSPVHNTTLGSMGTKVIYTEILPQVKNPLNMH